VSGNITLATIVFNATSAGSSTLALCNTKLAMYGAPGSTCQLMTHMNINGGVIIGVPTSSGTNVTVAPSDNVNVTFSEVANPGVTSLNLTQPPESPFVTVNCLDIKTTANYIGNITIQFAYDPTGLSLDEEQSMRIWLWNESAANWVDITTYVNTTSNIVYGLTPHLSIFGITSDLMTYGDTSIFGITTVRIPSSPPPPPSGLVALNCYEISASKNPQGPIEIHLAYDATNILPEMESFIQAWLWNESATPHWVDITTYVDTASNIVYGLTPHLSIFGITCPAPSPNEIAVISSTCSKHIVGQGYNITMNFTIENRGRSTDFDLLIFRNSTVLATYHVVNLPVNTQRTISFTWNTPSWAKGKYGISAYDHLMNWVLVTVPGDVDGNRIVNMIDLYNIAIHFGTSNGQPGYVANYDIEDNSIINMLDLYIAATHFGQTGF
jgi:hypothetical protein